MVRNPTVANLSLMALGSSAPEILLNVIEIVTGDFYAGDLGPSTIVGSAAFNLLVILAVCVAAITEGVKVIKETKVHCTRPPPLLGRRVRAPVGTAVPAAPLATDRSALASQRGCLVRPAGVRHHRVHLHLCLHLAAHHPSLLLARHH